MASNLVFIVFKYIYDVSHVGIAGGIGGGDDVPGPDMKDVEEFDMLRNDVDVAMEMAMAFPEYVLQDQDDILKATAFRCVAFNHKPRPYSAVTDTDFVFGKLVLDWGW